MFQQSSVVLRFGEDLAPSISVRGDGYHVQGKTTIRNTSPCSLPLKSGAVDLGPSDGFPVATDCSCIRSSASTLSARANKRSNSLERRLSDRFVHGELYDRRSHTGDDDEDEDDGVRLFTLFKTFSKFSGKHLNPLQAKSIARLANSYNGKDTLTDEVVDKVLEFLDADSPAIQEATLIALTRLIEKGDNNICLLFKTYGDVWDEILSLASDGPTVEVQLAALKTIEKVTSYQEYLSDWEGSIEDIVYPLIHAIIKNRESSTEQKAGSLGIMRNLSHVPVFAGLVKQDVVSQLLSVQDTSHMKGLYLLVLYENLQSSRQRVSTDILDNALLPVLVTMLQDGPCHTQQQSLNLLKYFVADEISRSSLLTTPGTVANILLCVNYSQCRKVRAFSLTILEQLLSTQNVVQARQFMECNSESMAFTKNTRQASKYSPLEDRTSSSTRRKSKAEAQLWQHFDVLIADLIVLLEREACIYHDKKQLTCGLSLIGSINADQLTCISSLIGCFNKLCQWPIQRPRKASGSLGTGDEEELSDDSWQDLISSINRHHTLDVWTKIGHHVMAIFRQVNKRLPSDNTISRPQSANKSRNKESAEAPTKKCGNVTDSSTSSPNEVCEKPSQRVNLNSLLHPEEYNLLVKLNEFILIVSTASCSFQSSTVNKLEEQGQGHKNGMNENQGSKKSKSEQLERESFTDRKFLRCHLVEEGVMLIVKQLLSHEDESLNNMSITTLRMCVQPVSDKDLNSSKSSVYVHRQVNKSRPQSATGRLETASRHTVNQQIFQMGRPGVGSRPQSAIPYLTSRSRSVISSSRPSSARTPQYILSGEDNSSSNVNVPRRVRTARDRPSSARYEVFHPLTPRSQQKPLFLRSGEQVVFQGRENPFSYGKADKGVGEKNKTVSFDEKGNIVKDISNSWEEVNPKVELAPPLDSKGNISSQCCHLAFLVAGEATLVGIFNKSRDVKKNCLFFLRDLVKHGSHEIHMKLSKLGCVSRLVDFLRVNDDDELLEISGLIITRMMISSDRRLCQLFNRHGGTNVLMALLKKYQETPLKQEVCSTLNAVNNIMHPPSSEDLDTRGPKDAWEHIMQRWTQEDEVVNVLKQFL